MNRYAQIFKTTLQEYFAYRLNFMLWRLRAILSSLIIIFLWSGVFDTSRSFGSYSKERMLSYILVSGLIATFVASSRVSGLAMEIQNGGIMNLLLKPLSVFGYYATTDAVDKAMNVLFGCFEFALIITTLGVRLVPLQSVGWALFFLINSLFISFSINLLLSFVAFWTPEVWAPRFLFMMIVIFVSGAYFPLDLLPPAVYRALLVTPFPYLYFLPSKTLIDGIQPVYIGQQLVCSVGWAGGLFLLAKYVWKRGIRDFSFWGR